MSNLTARRYGKSQFQKMMIDAELNCGKTVIVATSEITTKQRRVGKFTLIEKCHTKNESVYLLFDDFLKKSPD